MKTLKNTSYQNKQHGTVQNKMEQQSSKASILQLYKDRIDQMQVVSEGGIPLQRQSNNTGLPDNLKSGIENLSGYSMDDVKVHYNSSQPATLQAHAYAQGTDIHVAPGQEKHLAHEAWHVVQQKQGRVKPTMQMKGTVPVNDDAGLEKEADVMGSKAQQSQTIQRQPWSLEDLDGKSTDVEWTTTNLKGSTVGVKMVANPLGPEHLQGGPPKSSSLKKVMSKLPTNPKLPNNQKYIRGHLLNDNVGGPGEDYNLFPITANANKEHENKIESVVKQWVNNEKQWVKYEVDVSYDKKKNGHIDSVFDCNAEVLGSSKAVRARITSEFDETHTGKAKKTRGDNLAIGKQAAKFNPLWSKTKTKTAALDKDVIETLNFLFSAYPQETRNYLLSLRGVGDESVNAIESSLEEDIIDMNSFAGREIRAYNRIFKYEDLLGELGGLFLDLMDDEDSMELEE